MEAVKKTNWELKKEEHEGNKKHQMAGVKIGVSNVSVILAKEKSK